MKSIPQIPGYQFDQQLLTHPLADLWRGRSFTGMEVVALVLSDAGSHDAAVRDRLVQAGRGAALEPGQEETPLWAANFSSDRPYAITQLVPGQSGAERLIDPLDGIIGNDAEALQAVRSQLSQYGAVPPTGDTTPFPSYADQPQTDPHQPKPRPQSKVEIARQYRHKIGGWIYLASVLGVLFVFSITYSIGSAIGSTVKDEPVEAVPAAVSPSPLPSPALLPGVERITTAQYKQPTGSPGVVGATYAAGADVQPIVFAGLPFPFGWPRPPAVSSLGESSSAIYSRVADADRPGPAQGHARGADRAPPVPGPGRLSGRPRRVRRGLVEGVQRARAHHRQGRADLGRRAEVRAEDAVVHADDVARVPERRPLVAGRRRGHRCDRRGAGRPAHRQRHLAADQLIRRKSFTNGPRDQRGPFSFSQGSPESDCRQNFVSGLTC